jgi:hypothetical protein
VIGSVLSLLLSSLVRNIYLLYFTFSLLYGTGAGLIFTSGQTLSILYIFPFHALLNIFLFLYLLSILYVFIYSLHNILRDSQYYLLLKISFF